MQRMQHVKCCMPFKNTYYDDIHIRKKKLKQFNCV